MRFLRGVGNGQDTAAEASPEEVEANDSSYRGVEEPVAEGMHLVFRNQFAEAEGVLKGALEKAKARSRDFPKEPDLQVWVHMVGAVLSFFRGLLSLENNQLDEARERMQEGEKLAQLGPDWIGKTIMKGASLAGVGSALALQGSIMKGIWKLVRALRFIKEIRAGELYEGREKALVKGISLWTAGRLNVVTSKIPPFLLKAASLVVDIRGDQDEGIRQLTQLWREDTFMSAASAISLLEHFNSEDMGVRTAEKDRAMVSEILAWAMERYPGSVFFLDAQVIFHARQRRTSEAIALAESALPVAREYPAIAFAAHQRMLKLSMALLNWEQSAEHARSALAVQQSVSRRAHVPELAMHAAMCDHVAQKVGDATWDMLDTVRKYEKENKSDWPHEDRKAFECATQFPHRVKDPDGGPDIFNGEMVCIPWMIKLAEVVFWKKLVRFMPEEKSTTLTDFFSGILQKEDGFSGFIKVFCLNLMADIRLQAERPAEALEWCDKALALANSLPDRNVREFAYNYYIRASAFLDQGNLSKAKDAMSLFLACGKRFNDYMELSSRMSELNRYIGAQFEDSYKEFTVRARCVEEVRFKIPEDFPDQVSWDIALASHTLGFQAYFQAAASTDREELCRIEEHDAETGPIQGGFTPSGPGTLQLVFDNSFSYFKTKRLFYLVEPELAAA